MKLFKNKTKKSKLEEAVRRLPEGSAEAFRFLFSKYREEIYVYCLKIMKDTDSAEDAFQETFIKVFEHRSDFDGRSFKNWVYRIARNTCLNMAARKKEAVSFSEEYLAPSPVNQRDFRLEEEIGKSIDMLPPLLKEAFLMREYEDLSYADIGEILGIKTSLAKVRVHRARQKLQEAISPLIDIETEIFK